MKISEQDKIDICNQYQKGFTSFYLSKKYKTYASTICYILKKNNIPIKSASESHKKYEINENYFSKINDEGTAYFLGLLFADGYVKGNMVRICLQIEDSSILEKFRKIIKYTKPLRIREYSHKGWKDQSELCITNKTFCQDVISQGCTEKKSKTLKLPFIQENLLRHFIRGYFDGDGSLRWSKPKINNIPQSVISIIGTKNFCKNINKIVKNQTGISFQLIKHKSTKEMYNSQSNGNAKNITFLNWLYADANYYIERKYNKYIELVSLSTPEIKRLNLINTRNLSGIKDYRTKLISSRLRTCRE